MNKNELRKISAQFRRISAQFLSMESEEEFNYLIDLMDFIDNNPVLIDYVTKCKTQVFPKSVNFYESFRNLIPETGS